MKEEFATPMKTPMSSFSNGDGSSGNINDMPEKKVIDGDDESQYHDIMARLLPPRGSGVSGEVLILDANLSPYWGDGGGIPDGTATGQVPIWDETANGGDGGWTVDFLKWR